MIIFPLTTARPSGRLPAKEMVLGLRDAGESRAYPFSRMPDKAVINDRVGDRAVLVLYDAETATAIPYSRVVRGQLLTFRILSRTDDLRLSSGVELGSKPAVGLYRCGDRQRVEHARRGPCRPAQGSAVRANPSL